MSSYASGQRMSLVTLVTAGVFANVRRDIHAIDSAWQTATSCAPEMQSA